MDIYKTLPRLLTNLFLLSAFTLVTVLIATSANAASPQAQKALADNPALEYAPDSVLVKFRPAASSVQKINARALVRGEKIRSYGLVQGLEHMQLGRGQGVEKAIKILQQLPFVQYAEPDYVIHADTNDTFFDLQWGLHNTGQRINYIRGNSDADIDAPEAWDIATAAPTVVVAVIDTGVDYTHEDLIHNIWRNPGETPGNGIDDDNNGYIDDIYGWDFVGSEDNNPMDEEGHGTHVAGTICAEGNNGLGVTGVAWQCNIMALRFLGPDGGFASDAVAALNYAVAKGVRISNNSWGGGGYSQSLYDTIADAGSAGLLFVAAAGNGGFDGVGDDTDISAHYPSSYNLGNIISVAATDNKDRLAGFSNYGLSSVDLGAPGVDIASTMLSSYYWSSGTSMAAPHVSGVAALILGLHPEFTNTQVKDRILNTTRPIDALQGKTVTGGVVNAYAALGSGECGDGTVGPGEDCDDGGANGTTTCGCQADCTYNPCQTGETCDVEIDACVLLIACGDIKDKGACNEDPNCEWSGNPRNGSCGDAGVTEPPTNCSDYDDETNCKANDCRWNKKKLTCN